MRTINQLMLTLLLNACWQIPLLALMASCGGWLLKDYSARYRHWLWIGALLFSLTIPILGALPLLFESPALRAEPVSFALSESNNLHEPQASLPPTADHRNWSFQLNRTLVVGFLVFYFSVLFYRTLSLGNALRVTARIRRRANELNPTQNVVEIIDRCKTAIGERAKHIEMLESDSVYVPVTLGVLRPVIVLPSQLVREGSAELITSAMGHELVHVARRDYLLNLLYEILYLPLSFNPAASLIRRRIRQTRELCCDEIVAQRILNAETYARSLVKLATSAPPLTRLSVSTTVGIADADILEARIMSLLRKPKLTARWKKISLTALSILLLVPCVAAASFAMRFDVSSENQNAGGQDPSQQQEQEKKEKERREKERTGEIRIMRSPGVRGSAMADEADPQVREEIRRRQELELEAREKTHAALVRLVKIPMEQAIQIATSEAPGKVLECSLIGESWQEPGKLEKDARVLYHVTIVSGDESSPGATHVLVNAIDGTVEKVEKELPRKMRRAEPVNP